MSLVVLGAVGVITVQDAGRPGHMHEGLPRGGALVPELLARANRRAGNPDTAPALEVLGSLAVRASSPILVASDDETWQLAAGDGVTIAAAARRVTYLALRGGVDAPLILGARSTHLSAGIGSLLKTGATVRAAGAPPVDAPPRPFDGRPTIGVVPGPDTERFPTTALERLLTEPYVISPASNRVGTRLQGIALAPTGHDVTRPLVIGAIEVPPDGQPIVLGPEHPTTGGYAVIAVVTMSDLGRFHAIPPGGTVRFTATSG